MTDTKKLTVAEIKADQAKMATMPNYALWALLRVATEKQNNQQAMSNFIHHALKGYKEDSNLNEADEKVFSTLTKHLKDCDVKKVDKFFADKKHFMAALKEGNATLRDAIKFFHDLDWIYGFRHSFIKKEAGLADEYKNMVQSVGDLVAMLRKGFHVVK